MSKIAGLKVERFKLGKGIQSSDYSFAASLGFGYIDSGTFENYDNATVVGRFCDNPERKGPGIWVGVRKGYRLLLREPMGNTGG